MYGERKAAGASTEELTRREDDIRDMPHPTVWAEMKRQRALYPAFAELAKLFAACPEALDW